MSLDSLVAVNDIEDAEYVVFEKVKWNAAEKIGITLRKMYQVLIDDKDQFYILTNEGKRLYEFELFAKVVFFKNKEFVRETKPIEEREWVRIGDQRYEKLKPHIDTLDIGIPVPIINQAYELYGLDLIMLDVEFAELGIELEQECHYSIRSMIDKRRNEIIEERMRIIFS